MFDELRAAGRQARLLRPRRAPAVAAAGGPLDARARRWRTCSSRTGACRPRRCAPPFRRSSRSRSTTARRGSGSSLFRVTALRGRGLLPVPGISSFLQLNVRTYVRGPRREAGRLVLQPRRVEPARRARGCARVCYVLPFFHARLSLDATGDWHDVECVRIGERGRVFSGRYRAEGNESVSAPGLAGVRSSSSATACMRPTGPAARPRRDPSRAVVPARAPRRRSSWRRSRRSS